jgi:hypothetical protein
MNKRIDTSERGPVDFIIFGLIFYSFLLTLAGILLTSVAFAVVGFALLAFGVLAFCINELA